MFEKFTKYGFTKRFSFVDLIILGFFSQVISDYGLLTWQSGVAFIALMFSAAVTQKIHDAIFT